MRQSKSSIFVGIGSIIGVIAFIALLSSGAGLIAAILIGGAFVYLEQRWIKWGE